MIFSSFFSVGVDFLLKIRKFRIFKYEIKE
jgi:hypothetical protein